MVPDQSLLRAALLDPEHPVPPRLTDGQGRPTQKRFAVYRNNVFVALTDALRASFPILGKLLGDQNFGQLAGLFARAHPPSSPLMMHYGTEMPAFLETLEPLAHIGYLPDVARFELAMRRSYHAADTTPMNADTLGQVPPKALMASTLKLAPAVQLIPSAWPLFDLWRYNSVPDAPKPQAIPQSVVITRIEFDPEPHPLDPAQLAWITCIQNGDTLAQALDAALDETPEFDLTPLLTLLLQHGALTHLTTPKD